MSKPPCVLFLLDWQPLFWSTREEYFLQLSRQLVAKGLTPILVPSELNDPEVRRRFESVGAKVTPCSYHHGVFRYLVHVRQICREFTVKIAQVRFFDYFSGVPWICRMAGIQNIVFTEANSGEWNKAGWRQSLTHVRTAFMCWPLTRVIAISQFIQKRLENVGIARDRISVVYNGVDISAFQPDRDVRSEVREQMGARESTIVLVFAAVFLAWKRPDVALRVCAELVRRGTDVQLWMLGQGHLREKLEQDAKDLKITENVKWLGHQKNPQRWMAGADLFLHTTVGEAFGNVFIEAMGCGLPVAASRSGAAPELVVEGSTGKLVNVEANEVARFADAILELTRDRNRYAEFSAHAAEHAKRFSTEVSVARTLAVYDRLLS